MKIQAELSLYPLKTGAIEKEIRDFIHALKQSAISVAPGPMSTLVAGESEEVFRVVGASFDTACQTGKVVLIVKFSNACPDNTLRKGEGQPTSLFTARGLKTTGLPDGSPRMVAEIDENNCMGCGKCVLACPVKAITMNHVAKVNAETCTGCGVCVSECPSEAIYLDRMETSSIPRLSHRLLPPTTTSRVATTMTMNQEGKTQPGFQPLDRTRGFLAQLVDLFRSPAGQGGGRGRGRGGGRGRGKGRRG